MSEAPKKIWMIEETDWYNHVQEYGDIPYIREDLVLELVEALKDAKCWSCRGIHKRDIVPKIEAALAKLEESHD